MTSSMAQTLTPGRIGLHLGLFDFGLVGAGLDHARGAHEARPYKYPCKCICKSHPHGDETLLAKLGISYGYLYWTKVQ